MIRIRKSADRGKTLIGWLESMHSFSFADYYDPEHVTFGPLRVINEDIVSPGQGFAMHGHKDMEIISYVLDGALEHKDSLGSGSVIRPGDVQRMTAGSGIQHSEFNPSETEDVHFLQIWILPEENGLPPSYEQKKFGSELENTLQLIASPTGDNGSVTIHQDVNLYAGKLKSDCELTHTIENNGKVWIQVVKGTIRLNEHDLNAGDGAAIEDVSALSMKATSDTEVLLFDMK